MTPEQFMTIAGDIDALLDKYGFQVGFAYGDEECEMKISIEPKDKIYSRCLRCGKRLKSEEAMARGYGKVCWEKHQKDIQSRLF